MSSAFYPLGMKSYNNHTSQGGYKSWKGTGLFRTPMGITTTNIRPLTNNDTGNMFPTGHGLPRPLKHYRKGSLPPNPYLAELTQTNERIAFNLDRRVKSSNDGLIRKLIDTPGSVSMKNTSLTIDPSVQSNCDICQGTAVFSDLIPINSLTETPDPDQITGNPCCNNERKAIRSVLPNPTKLSKTYYQTTYAKLYNRCKTFDQNQTAYLTGFSGKSLTDALQAYPQYTAAFIKKVKPGSPLALKLDYIYIGQCNPNGVVEKATETDFIVAISDYLFDEGLITQQQMEYLSALSISEFIKSALEIIPEGQYTLMVNYIYKMASELANDKTCSKVISKPNNYKYSKQGAVTAGDRLLRLNVDTINKNLSQIKKGFDVKRNDCKDACYTSTANYVPTRR